MRRKGSAVIHYHVPDEDLPVLVRRKMVGSSSEQRYFKGSEPR